MSLRLYKLEAKVQARARRLDALEQRAPRPPPPTLTLSHHKT